MAVLGCLYLFYSLQTRTKIYVLIWNVVGLVIYLLWARRKSLLEPAAQPRRIQCRRQETEAKLSTAANAAPLSFPSFSLPARVSCRRTGQELGCSTDAFSAVARAASPLTRSFQLSSWPLRRPFSVSFKPCGEIVTTYGFVVDD